MNRTDADSIRLRQLLDRLVKLDHEVSWVEFKHNDAEPAAIGEYLSALSNAAALEDRRDGFMVWGVEDATHRIVGTSFRPHRAKRGGEDLLPWLTRGLQPQLDFTFDELEVEGQHVVILRVSAAAERPTQFDGTEWIRVGSYKKKLKDYPDHARRLWKVFDLRAFESLVATDHLTDAEVLDLLDHEAYFRLIDHPLPESVQEILEQLGRAEIVRWDIADQWSITNLGALLLAKDLSAFPSLLRKAPRVVQYRGTLRTDAVRDDTFEQGFAVGFEHLYRHVMGLVPRTESYETGLREELPIYPGIAVRELLANMLVHQDLSVTGTGPTVEFLSNRLEITNPGLPLIDKSRFVDTPPISRNERLAKALRQMGICEERGSGWDKIALQVEVNQLPAPLIDAMGVHTRVTVYGHKSFQSLTREDRLRAVYLHAVLRHLGGEQTTNASVRGRFGLGQKRASTVSRLLAEAVDQHWLVPHDREVGKRAMAYVPFWAGQGDQEAERGS